MLLGRAAHTTRGVSWRTIPAIGLAELGLWLTRVLVPPSLLRETNDVVGNHLQTLGTIYAVLLAFIVFVVWTQFNDARQHVECEANELLDLFRTAGALPHPRRERVRVGLVLYVDAVLEREWPAMACGHSHVFDEVGTHLDGVWDTL